MKRTSLWVVSSVLSLALASGAAWAQTGETHGNTEGAQHNTNTNANTEGNHGGTAPAATTTGTGEGQAPAATAQGTGEGHGSTAPATGEGHGSTAPAEPAHQNAEHPNTNAAHGEGSHEGGSHAAGNHEAAHGEHGASGEHGEHGEHGAAHGGHGEEHGPAAINWTQFGGTRADEHGARVPMQPPLVATVINFLLLVTILWIAVRRAINPSLASNRAAVEAEMGEAQRLRAEAEALLREYTEKLAQLPDEMASLRREFVEQGERERDRLVEEAKRRAEQMRKDGEFAVQQELKTLRAELYREAVDAAVAAAEEAVRTNINAQDHSRLADDFIAGIEKNDRGNQGARG